MLFTLVQLFILLATPWLLLRASKWSNWGDFMSPVVLCYVTGMFFKNLSGLPLQTPVSELASQGSIVLALPLLLFATDWGLVRRHTKTYFLAFLLAIVGNIVSLSICAWWFKGSLPQVWQAAGMLAGIYTGGTANMQAVGIALQAPQNTFILLNGADILMGGIYLLFLTSLAHRLLRGFLPDFVAPSNSSSGATADFAPLPLRPLAVVGHLLTSLALVALAGTLTWLLFGNLQATSFLMLLLTSLSIAAAQIPLVRRQITSIQTGEYLLLIFCVALGLLADLRDMASKGGLILLFCGVSLWLAVGIHLLLARWLRIDRDIFLIASTATIFGPPFIAQVASAINNRRLIFPGIALALLGIALGNYVGIGLAYFLRWWLGPA